MQVDVRQERIDRGWSLDYMAKQVGLSLTAVQKIETGKRNPSYSVYCKLMSIFGYEYPRLVFGEASGKVPPIAQRQYNRPKRRLKD